MRRFPIRLLAAGTLPVLLLAGCGSSSSNGSGSSSTAAKSSKAAASTSKGATKPYTVAAKDVSSMSDAKVSTKDAKKPSISLGKKPFQVNKTTTKVLHKGTGATADKAAVVNYTVVVGSSGKAIANTFAQTPTGLVLSDETQLPGLVKAIKGAKVGTTEVVAIPPKDGFGTAGNQQIGVTGKDTLVAYISVKSAVDPLPQAQGQSVAPKSGMPKVKWNGSSKPATITTPNAAAPKKLQTQNLINGNGATVKKGQSLFAQYTGAIWTKGKAGKVFDSTGSRKGMPAAFPIGVGGVIPGWDKALVGKKVGDRVLIVVPPAEGYGSQGNPQGGIKGTDTLMFVVDIVGVG